MIFSSRQSDSKPVTARAGLCGLIAAALFAITPNASHAAPPTRANLVSAELVADTGAVVPGRPFTVGVKLKVTSGWHVYWINPGDSGQPVEVEWKLPEGFTASPLQYPLPERFKDAGNLISNGYTREVMLFSTITPPADAAKKSTDPVKLVGDVTWLVCRTECIPGKATVSLELPVRSKVEPVYSVEIEKWRESIPKDSSDSDAVHSPQVSLPPDPDKGGKLTLTFKVKPGELTTTEGIEWFPPPSESIQYEQPKFELNKARLVMNVQYKVFEGQHAEPGRRESVLAFRTADGVRRGIAVPVQFRAE